MSLSRLSGPGNGYLERLVCVYAGSLLQLKQASTQFKHYTKLSRSAVTLTGHVYHYLNITIGNAAISKIAES